MFTKISIPALLSIFFFCCHGKDTDTFKEEKNIINEKRINNMKLTSSSFNNDGMIPAKYTCDAENVSPQLAWSDIPAGTQTFALICDDPDAPAGDWVHWVVFNVPNTVTELPENTPQNHTLGNGAVQGLNDFKKIGYDGPCPPGGTHRYFFKLYALDMIMTYEAEVTKSALLKGIEGHKLGEATLIGKYKR
jgi:Raf kinase inhibitor-like YbhB/YbcL family protein